MRPGPIAHSNVPEKVWTSLLQLEAPPLPDSHRVRSFVGHVLFDQLFEYQKEAIAFIVSQRGRALLSLDMGMGKTVVSIAVMEAYRNFRQGVANIILVLCPSKVCGQFASAIQNWLPQTKGLVAVGKLAAPSSKNTSLCYIVMSYTQARLSVAILRQYPIVGIIADESQQLKNSQSATVVALRPLFLHVKRVLLLSGSPLNRPRDIWVQLSLLQPHMAPLNDERAFRVRYCGPTVKWITQQQYRWEYNGRSRTAELNLLLRRRFMFRLERNQVKELGLLTAGRNRSFETTSVRHIVWVEGTDLQTARRHLEQESDSSLREVLRIRDATWAQNRRMEDIEEVQTGIDVDQQKQQAEFLRFKLLTAKAKLKVARPWLLAYLQSARQRNEKTVLFAEHHSIFSELEQITLEAMQVDPTDFSASVSDPALYLAALFIPNICSDPSACAPKGLPFIRIDGSSGSIRTVSAEIQRFQKNSDCHVAIVSIRAGGTGIELTSANNIVFVETTFNGDELVQAEARCLRLGQVKQVHTTFLLMRGSVEEAVWDIVRQKLTHMSRLIENRALTFDIEDEITITATAGSKAAE